MERMPNDPVMLLSLVNMRLRDRYATLQALCQDLGWEESALREKLENISYRYSEAQNQFV